MVLVAPGKKRGGELGVGLGSVKSGPIPLLSKKPVIQWAEVLSLSWRKRARRGEVRVGHLSAASPSHIGPPWGLAVSSRFCPVSWEDQLLKN